MYLNKLSHIDLSLRMAEHYTLCVSASISMAYRASQHGSPCKQIGCHLVLQPGCMYSKNKDGGHLKRHAQELGQQPFKKSRFAAEQAELDEAEKAAKGQFADVIKSELRPAAPSANPGNTTSVKAEQHAPTRIKPEYQKFVASHLKRPPAYGTSLYDALPPEKQKADML